MINKVQKTLFICCCKKLIQAPNFTYLLDLFPKEASVLTCVASLSLRSCLRRAASRESSCESLVPLTLLCVVVRRTEPAMDREIAIRTRDQTNYVKLGKRTKKKGELSPHFHLGSTKTYLPRQVILSTIMPSVYHYEKIKNQVQSAKKQMYISGLYSSYNFKVNPEKNGY